MRDLNLFQTNHAEKLYRLLIAHVTVYCIRFLKQYMSHFCIDVFSRILVWRKLLQK